MIERVFVRGAVSTKILKLQTAETLHKEGFDIEVNDGIIACVIKRAALQSDSKVKKLT